MESRSPPDIQRSSSGLASTTYSPDGETDPASPEWQQYYARASRRRRAIRKRLGHKTHVDERKRRRLIEIVLLTGSFALLGALTAIFHALLTR